ncbi:hypothetical protein BC332_19906 [Capsicum chinense]|nr:hypothetical protein BC332_19906 [Capsicum chinense]
MIASNQFLLVLRTCVTTTPNQQELWCSGGTAPPLIRGLGFKPWIWRNPVGGSATSHNGPCNVRSGLVGFQWALDTINQRSRIRALDMEKILLGAETSMGIGDRWETKKKKRLPFLRKTRFQALTTFFITWLANFKLTLFAFDQGPLVINAPAANAKKLSLLVFICIATLPLRAKQHGFTSNFNRKIPLNLAAECVILAACMEMILRATSEMHHKLVLIVYCVMIFLVIDILVAFSSFIIKYFVGLEVELDPPSNEPYFSTSLQDFWGRRWNLTVTNMLRLSVYNPVRWVVVVVVGKERARWAQRVAMLATFLVSGLMHELIFYYVNNVRPSWEMTGFFALHGLCVVVETDVKRVLKDTWRLSGLVSGPLTIGFVMVTSFGLFFPPLIRNGADVKLLEEFVFCCDFFKLKMLQFGSNPKPLVKGGAAPSTASHPLVVLLLLFYHALSSFIVKNIMVGLDLELELPSNEPYLSTSLQDFWGHRWNLTVTNILRLTVYDPMTSALCHVVGKEWARRVAMLATFVVSGLMHELLFYYVNGVRPSWEMTGFFVLHGLCVMGEIGVKKGLKDTWQLPGFVSGPLTVGFVVVTAFGLFFPPIIRNGADERVLEEVGFCFDLFKDKMLQFVEYFG